MRPRRSPLAWWARAFAVASLVHLTLPDFAQAGWGPPGVVEGLGALILLVRPHPAGFALCAVGTLWPLLALRDVLTQSTLLTLWAVVALVGGRRRAGAALTAVRWTTAATYLLAALHKLNTTWFDPAYGCAEHAWAQVMARYGAPAMPAPAWVALGVEVALGVLILRRSPWMWPVGLAFHLPLTVTLAPAFGPVMLAGYAAATTPRQAVRWRRALRRQGWLAGGAAVAAGAVELGMTGEVATTLKVGAAAGLGVLGLVVALQGRRRDRGRVHRGGLPAVALALWVANGLTPYLGLQYQHTAAMLSGLRVDAGCHNSLVMPEALRLVDPYIRLDVARVGPGHRPERERILLETLWNLPALYTMRANWCIPENRPITLGGTWDGVAFTVPDLCADGWRAALPGGPDWLPGFQRFQKNLRRTCPTACIH
ncbi:MAG: hypothetical protein H6706_11265 [Myxococcales bacterium]|nr:hypothetical protein [Myxococcales bacterium]